MPSKSDCVRSILDDSSGSSAFGDNTNNGGSDEDEKAMEDGLDPNLHYPSKYATFDKKIFDFPNYSHGSNALFAFFILFLLPGSICELKNQCDHISEFLECMPKCFCDATGAVEQYLVDQCSYQEEYVCGSGSRIDPTIIPWSAVAGAVAVLYKTSPSQVVLDTLGRIQEDARVDPGAQSKYDSLLHQCNVTLERLHKQIALDESRVRREHDALEMDVGRITSALNSVNTLEEQLKRARHAASRANRTLDDLRGLRNLQVAYFASHSKFLSKTESMLTGLHEYLDTPPGHLSRNNVPAKNDKSLAESSFAQLSQNIVQYRRRLGHFRKSMRALVARSLRGYASDGRAEELGRDYDNVDPIRPPSNVFHRSFHSTLEELKSVLGNATAEYASDSEGASSYFEAAFETLRAEAGLQRGKVTKLHAKLERAREKHRTAVLVMEHTKESPGDMSRKFLMKNADAALRATESQCNFLMRAQASRQAHREQDRKAAELTQKLVRRMTDDIVARMSRK
eukprot:g5254.t1